MKYIKSIICFLLCIVLLSTSCFVAAAKPSGTDLLLDTASVDAWNSKLSVLDIPYYIVQFLLGGRFWASVDYVFSAVGLGSCSSDALGGIAEDFYTHANLYCSNNFFLIFPDLQIYQFLNFYKCEVAYDSQLGVRRLRSVGTGLWLVNSSGHFPYYRPESETPDAGEVVTPQRDDLLLGVPDVSFETVHRVSKAQLGIIAGYYSGAQQIQNKTNGYTKYVIKVGSKYVCDADGFPYAYVPESQGLASDQTQDVFTEAGATGTVDDGTSEIPITQVTEGDTTSIQILDVDNYNIFNGQIIDKVVYDNTSKTYYVDSHDKYTYNTTTNKYETNNYRYEITYNVAYTSVTYIGATGEYTERYDYYYQLPDGRSSADLTVSDLEQLSTVFVDVVNYTRSTDDAGLRALYHFDGDTMDSSYWSYAGSLEWLHGASLTYLESGTFGGCLYLDELDHSFRINLPTEYDVYQDFTLQFRYYQSHTETPVMDSEIAVGSKVLMRTNGAGYYAGDGVKVICETNPGTWNEICIMRKNGIVNYYVNGVFYYSMIYNNVLDPFVRFTFLNKQQTYKYIDELRYSVEAIYEPGVNYTCSSVPFDSNLALILPDGEVPIPDSVPKVVSSANNILTQYGLDDWTDESIMERIGAPSQQLNYDGSPAVMCAMNHSFTGSSVKVTSTGTYSAPSDYVGAAPVNDSSDYIFFPLSFAQKILQAQQPVSNLSVNTNLCLTIVFDDLSYVSYKFRIQRLTDSLSAFYAPVGATTVYNDSTGYFQAYYLADDPDYGTLYMAYGYGIVYNMNCSYYRCYGIKFYFPSATSKNIIHMELVPGSEPEFSLSYQTSYYSSGQLQEAPVLAARTNLPVTGYQIGGVRPVYPDKGLVYALVENGYISSLQQYNGTAWVQINGRIWTGSRWIPYSSYNVLTMQEFIDIYDSSGSDVVYIYTEQGFWGFMQTSMNKVINLLQQIADSLSGGGADSEEKQQIVINITQIFEDEDDEDEKNDILESFKFLKRLKDLLFVGFDNSFVDGFFNLFTDEDSTLFDFFDVSDWSFDPEEVTNDVE